MWAFCFCLSLTLNGNALTRDFLRLERLGVFNPFSPQGIRMDKPVRENLSSPPWFESRIYEKAYRWVRRFGLRRQVPVGSVGEYM